MSYNSLLEAIQITKREFEPFPLAMKDKWEIFFSIILYHDANLKTLFYSVLEDEARPERV